MKDSRLAIKIICAVLFFVFAVVAIYPWRIKSKNEWSQNDLNAKIVREHGKIRETVAATENLPPDDDRRLAALKQLADVDWQENKLDEAEKIVAGLWTHYEKNQKPNYDNNYADVMLMAAGIHRDQGRVDLSERNYDQIYFYDLHHEDSTTRKRIARDLNNLGVAYYLVGLSKPKNADGIEYYDKSIEYFEEALQNYRELYGANSQYEANTLYNESLSLRDSGQVAHAQEIRTQSDKLMSMVKRPCKLP
ncbi:MAG TPA: tetratricopeptide repeat protein [Planktothrix sp.]